MEAVLGETLVTVAEEKVSITDLKAQVVSSLSLSLHPSPGNSHTIIARTSVQQTLSFLKQVGPGGVHLGLGGLVRDLGWGEGYICKSPSPKSCRHHGDPQSTPETFTQTYEPTLPSLGTGHNHGDKGVWKKSCTVPSPDPGTSGAGICGERGQVWGKLRKEQAKGRN